VSRVSYFQRFSQSENHATNNTLLVLRYFYQSSPFKIQRVLTSLLETELSIGLTFDQQVKGDASVPDALIVQEPMRIFVETKRGEVLDAGQIRRHFKSIVQLEGRSRGDVLLGLSKEAIADSERKSLATEGASQGITFAAITFSQIVEALRSQCADFERELLAIVEDYEDYLMDEGLLVERNQKMAIFPCGTSIRENVRFNLYYEPPSRRCKRNSFIGIYNQRNVSHVGTVQTIAVCSYKKNTPSFTEEAGKLTDGQRKRISDVIEETPYYDLKANPHRFYLVDEFTPTDCKKVSPGGIMGFRYLDLSKLLPAYDPRKDYTTAELAALLRGTSWI
jgi:hypothetical protein